MNRDRPGLVYFLPEGAEPRKLSPEEVDDLFLLRGYGMGASPRGAPDSPRLGVD